jgi:hypothetical protein
MNVPFVAPQSITSGPVRAREEGGHNHQVPPEPPDEQHKLLTCITGRQCHKPFQSQRRVAPLTDSRSVIRGEFPDQKGSPAPLILESQFNNSNHFTVNV